MSEFGTIRMDGNIKSWLARVRDELYGEFLCVWYGYNKVRSCAMPASKTVRSWMERESRLKGI